MSNSYEIQPPIPISMLFDGRLERFNIREKNPESAVAEDIFGHPYDWESQRRRAIANEFYYTWEHLDELSPRLLTDGVGSVRVEPNAQGYVCDIRLGNAPDNIVNAIEEACDCRIVSDNDPEFWGYDTWEEFHAAVEEQRAKDVVEATKRKHYFEFLAELRKFLDGYPCRLKLGSRGMAMAERAQLQIERKPDLVKPANEAALLDLIFL